MYLFHKCEYPGCTSCAISRVNQEKDTLEDSTFCLKHCPSPEEESASIIQYIMPMLNTLMSGLERTSKQVATFMANLFGMSYKQAADARKKLQDTAAAAKIRMLFAARFKSCVLFIVIKFYNIKFQISNFQNRHPK